MSEQRQACCFGDCTGWVIAGHRYCSRHSQFDTIYPRPDDYKSRTKLEIIEKIENRVGAIGEICDQVGIGRRTFYQWRDEDPEFKKAIERAQKYAREDLIDEAIRRAMKGSDKLMIRLLEAYFPELFTQRRDLAVHGDLEQLLANLPRGSAKSGPGTDSPLA